MMIVNNVGAAALALAGLAAASPVELQERQSCPKIHVFGARETTAPAGYGTAGVVVNLVLNAYPGSTAEAINYPACGGQASCGGATYAQSALAGTSAIASAVNSFNQRCPSTQLVIVGYSQGGQISDNAFCGGGDTNIGLTSTAVPISASALNQIKAAIFMGDPRYIAGLPYNVGTCTQQGVSSSCRASELNTDSLHSSPLDLLASSAQLLRQQRSSLTATLLTHTVARAATRPLTRATAPSMVNRRLRSSRPSSLLRQSAAAVCGKSSAISEHEQMYIATFMYIRMIHLPLLGNDGRCLGEPVSYHARSS